MADTAGVTDVDDKDIYELINYRMIKMKILAIKTLWKWKNRQTWKFLKKMKNQKL